MVSYDLSPYLVLYFSSGRSLLEVSRMVSVTALGNVCCKASLRF